MNKQDLRTEIVAAMLEDDDFPTVSTRRFKRITERLCSVATKFESSENRGDTPTEGGNLKHTEKHTSETSDQMRARARRWPPSPTFFLALELNTQATETTMTMTIQLGAKYRDTLHGQVGIATTHARYLTGCDRVNLEWTNKDGEIKGLWVDINRLERVSTAEVYEVPVTASGVVEVPGGPQPNPTRRGI